MTAAVATALLAPGRDALSPAAAGSSILGIALVGQRLVAAVGGMNLLYEGALFLDDYQSFVDTSRPPAPTHATPHPAPRTIRADDVSFTYPGQSTPALVGASVRIEQGEVIALVGMNGSGKTTLAKILCGLYQPQRGTVRWDGRNLTGQDQEAIRGACAVAFQDFARYWLSVRENVGLGRHERIGDVPAVQASLVQARAADTVTGLPDGMETRLGPEYAGGRDLSLGEWQRVALARVLFRDAPVVILDEPSASLDPVTERDLFDDVAQLTVGRTVLLITHRLANVRSADRIYVLDRGRVVQEGTHDELVRRDGAYAQLYLTQAAPYQPQSLQSDGKDAG